MPLTKSGKKVLEGFKKRYGKRGSQVFYMTMRKRKKQTKKWHA